MESPIWFLGEKKKKDAQYPYLMGPFYKVHYQEKKLADNIDFWIAKKRYGDNVDVASMNFYNDPTKKLPWFNFLFIAVVIYSLIIMMECFYRTDFVNLTICVLSLYFMYAQQDNTSDPNDPTNSPAYK